MFSSIFLSLFIIPALSDYFEDDLKLKESSLVEIRAVFIDCQINLQDNQFSYGSESLRFQREEIFKHNSLRDCKKKLILTVKMTSESSLSSGDEYIPIEHVFDGSNKKRVRLLNPYILRLRRELPYEAYKLQELDTFSVVLTTSTEKSYKTQRQVTKNRRRRNTQFTYLNDWVAPNQNSDETYTQMCLKAKTGNKSGYRQKRFHYDSHIQNNPFDNNIQTYIMNRNDHENVGYNKTKLNYEMPYYLKQSQNVTETFRPVKEKDSLDNTENIFKLYEISEPDIWFVAQVQLLGKLSTPEGKTLWKDLTRQQPVQISSLCPEWSNQYVNIRYRCAEWIPKEGFTLPSTGIGLLLPQSGIIRDTISNAKLGDFLIVPFEDIEVIEHRSNAKGNKENCSVNDGSGFEGSHHRLLVQLSRALFGKREDNYTIINKGTDKYLRIPYKRPHHAQIELEARADENQLVYVGSSGRLTTAVSESTRRNRAILTVQVTNTGLAAARFRPKIRDCTPEIMKFKEIEVEDAAKPILIPPMHTHKFCFELPLEMPGEIAQCSLVLLNGNEESIAVRDLRIKRGDRCFCVWHCQCVCLNEDPKLLCEEMAEYQQVAAGLSLRDRPRRVRSACYPDVVTINLLSIAFGVIVLLLVMGLIKACLGVFLRCVGSWGIDQLLQTPRKLDHYYERSLHSRTVVYDVEGWPVHPDTMKRTVRLISKPVEFILNVLFFVIMPWLVLWKSFKQIILRCQNKENNNRCDYQANARKSHDIQAKDVKEARLHWRRRRRHLNRWMSPQAEELSTDIWRNGLAPHGYNPPPCMRPLLQKDRLQGNLYNLDSPVGDSEHDDTEYVLMQMHNSRELLAAHTKHKT